MDSEDITDLMMVQAILTPEVAQFLKETNKVLKS
jgi:hypothetical protein